MTIKLNENSRSVRDTETVTILKNLLQPRGVAVDWVSKKIYVTDSNKIVVSTFDGKNYYILINMDIHQPRDVVVAPVQGLLFWTDWGPLARIEMSYMDGNKRKPLVVGGIVWPTGLAVDHPAERLYWSDPKTQMIESVTFNGRDRHVVKRFSQGEFFNFYFEVIFGFFLSVF